MIVNLLIYISILAACYYIGTIIKKVKLLNKYADKIFLGLFYFILFLTYIIYIISKSKEIEVLYGAMVYAAILYLSIVGGYFNIIQYLDGKQLGEDIGNMFNKKDNNDHTSNNDDLFL